MSEQVPVVTRISETFNNPNADIQFVSSDGVGFNILKDNLNSTSEILAVPEHTVIESKPTPVVLSERAEVLELLFQFVQVPSEGRNIRHPDLAAIGDTKLFFDLAEAGEKYGVYSLNTVSVVVMELLLSRNKRCVEILNHCLVHHLPRRLLDDAASQSVSKPLAEVINGLARPKDVYSWVSFHGTYMECRNSIADCISRAADSYSTCLYARDLFMSYWKATTKDLGTVRVIPRDLVTDHKCPIYTRGGCWSESGLYLDDIATGKAAKLRAFSTFVVDH